VDTYYGHVTKTLLKSTQVKRGQKVAELLADGSNTHLHFTITKPPPNTNELIFENSIDPSPFFNAQLNYFDGTRRFKRAVSGWCNAAPNGIIKGLVKTQNGEGVSDARVEIEGTAQYRITDYWMGSNQGGYIFSNAPVRKVKISARKSGVGNGSVVVTVKTSKTVKAPDIILR
jgi:murein DD-endopeptidase MepM/ murein hydrolase activator NlpD